MQSTEKGFVKCVSWHEVSVLLQGKAAILTSPLPAGYLSGDRALAASCYWFFKILWQASTPASGFCHALWRQ